MKSIFPGFYKRNEEELSEIWQEGIFVFDTNMLLNVYRYTKKTRDRYLEILSLLKQRNQLWIPYQVAYEYHDRRAAVIQDQLDAYTQVASILQTTAQKLENSLNSYLHKHEFIHADELIEEINTVIKKAKITVTQSRSKDKREYEALKKRDILLEKLEELFQGNIGSPYKGEVQRELYRQAQIRVELKIPPGWGEDEDKKGYRRYGDVMLWFQLLDYARSREKHIIIVTDDGKKDWWVQDQQGKPTMPLPELIQEMFIEADVLLHMYQGYSFIEAATQFFKLTKQPEVVKEAKEVTEQNIAEINRVLRNVVVDVNSSIRGYLVEEAVLKWLYKTYRTSNKFSINRASSTDFIMTEPDGTSVGVEVKTDRNSGSPSWLANLAHLVNAFHDRAEYFDKLMIVIVCRSLERAGFLAERIKETIKIPENTSFVIGYLDDETNFVVFLVVS